MFISIEGIDGTGKTSLSKQLFRALDGTSIRPYILHEPGGTPSAEQLRNLIMDEKHQLSDNAKMFLFLAAREELLANKLTELIADNTDIIIDRYIHSTLAYQAFGAQRDPDLIWQLINMTLPPKPDMVLWLDGQPEEMLKRIPSKEKDILDKYDVEYYRRVQQGYLAMHDGLLKDNTKWYRIDASLPQRNVMTEALTCIFKQNKEKV